MDNVTHTLVGLALAEAGLKRRTALASATLMIGANFPDIDVIAVPLGHSTEWRRGITHGIPAQIILPFVLAGIMLLWDRHVRRRRDPGATPADYKQLALLSGVAILTHPALDYMNSYGMRWLMPIVDKWFYADGLFIIDPWMLLALAVGVLWSRRSGSTRPAGIVLAGIAGYVAASLAVTEVGRRAVAAQHPGSRFMVAPVPIVPWRREVVIELGDNYHLGTFSPRRGVTLGPAIEIGAGHPAVALARELPEVKAYLHWARFPTYRVSVDGRTAIIRVWDARYPGMEWASVEVRLPYDPS